MNASTLRADVVSSRATKMLMVLFDHWRLRTADQLNVLGLPKSRRRVLAKYRAGDFPADDRDKLERVSMLLRMHKTLRLLFPNDRDVVYGWIKMPNRAFHHLTPLQHIDKHGMLGLHQVLVYLNRQLHGS